MRVRKQASARSRVTRGSAKKIFLLPLVVMRQSRSQSPRFFWSAPGSSQDAWSLLPKVIAGSGNEIGDAFPRGSPFLRVCVYFAGIAKFRDYSQSTTTTTKTEKKTNVNRDCILPEIIVPLASYHYICNHGNIPAAPSLLSPQPPSK